MLVNLKGYFDRNFGDDYMFKIVADALPDINFVVEKQGKISDVVSKCNNIEVAEKYVEDSLNVRVTGSGFMINSREAFITELVWFLKRKRDADICINCNIETFKNKIHEYLMAHKLNQYKLITCRDTYSYEWLQKHTKKPEIKCYPDILFSLDVPKNKDGKKLGIAMMHRAGDGAECHYYKKMAEIADWWIETTGQGVLLMAFDTGKEDDFYACCCVEKLMLHKEKAEFLAHDKGGEIIKAFSECRKIIGARFHSVVLAMKMGIDVYPITFRNKTKSLLKDMGYPLKGSDISNINEEVIKNFLSQGMHGFKLPSDCERTAKQHLKVLNDFLLTQQKQKMRQ